MTPDSRAFYTNRLYAEAEASLLYGIRERRGFVLLTGEVGTGKTTILRRVMEQLSGETPFVLVFHTNLSFEEILAFICHELEIEVAAPTRLAQIEALNAFLLEQTRNGRTTALLVDEAQNLNDEALEGVRLLSNLETGSEKLLQIVLAGQPELEARLASPGLRQLTQRIALRCRLGQLEVQEVGPYIRRRLECAGASRDDVFAPEAITRVAIHSKGVPRLINMICDNALLIAFAASRHTVGGDIVTEVADDLRLRETRPAPGEDVLGLESVFHRVEHAVASAAVSAPPKGRDLLWAVLLAGLFMGAGVLAMSSLRGDRSVQARVGGIAADSPGLAGPETSVEDPDRTSSVIAVSPAAAEEVSSRSTMDTTEPEAAASPPRAARKQQSPRQPASILYSVPPGSTAYGIAGAAYGSWCQLGLDLMAEANPGVEDLDRIAAGRRLRLPSLGRETLLRAGSNGTDRIVLASYVSPVAANRFAKHVVRRGGYDVRVVPRRVSGRVVSHRVEIVGLRGGETAHAWRRAEQLELLPPQVTAFADERSPKDRAVTAACVHSPGISGN